MRGALLVGAVLATALVVQPLAPGGALVAAYELRTWATTSAAPEGDPLSGSASYDMRSRVGGPFVGHAESASFALWGCSAYTPVEGLVHATADGSEQVVVEWFIDVLGGIQGFHVYRSLDAEGPFTRVTGEPLSAVGHGTYMDETVWPGAEFWYELRAVYADGSEEVVQPGAVSVTTGGRLTTKLYAAMPNPFRGETTLRFDVASAIGPVSLRIFDVSGRVVKEIDDSPRRSGRYELVWNGTDTRGARVASGVYFCRLVVGEVVDTRSIVLLR